MTNELPDHVVESTRERLRKFFERRPDVSCPAIAANSTLSDSTVRAFFGGGIRGGREVISEVNRVLDLADAGDILTPAGSSSIVLSVERGASTRKVRRRHGFYETETVRKVGEVLEYCSERAAIGVVTADFGAGKTEAVRAWKRGPGRDSNCVVFEFDEFSCGNKVDFVCCLARQVGAEFLAGLQNGGRVFRGLCDKLREDPCLLVLDQCESVRPRVFQVIRQIWDRTHEAGVGVVLLSAPVLMSRMLGSRMADLGALTSRVAIWAPLSGLTKAEMVAIVRQEGITDIDDAAFNLWYRGTGGSMRRLMRSLELLRAKHAGKKISERTIEGVAAHLWGMQFSGRTEEAAAAPAETSSTAAA